MRTKLFFTLCCVLLSVVISAASFETDSFKTKDGHTLTIRFIKHGSLALIYDNHTIQVDPVSVYADYSKFPKADVILITHEHPDHLDLKAISVLEKKGTVIVANESSQKKIGKGIAMKNGDKLEPVPYLNIEAVPAYNTTRGKEQFHPKSRDNGYILTLGGDRIYIAGDTEDIPEMKKLKNIDIAFLPVNQPYTMTVEQAVKAAKMFKPRILYPYHYGGTNAIEIKEKLKNERSIDVRIRQMQ
ncbi:MAG: MBL fold metallo-hydrolase [Bacteroidota bacterium]|nr:MBL fold metallo-hydrolase [Bacteroidota bacterium]